MPHICVIFDWYSLKIHVTFFMRTFCSLSIVAFLVFSLSACKKDVQSKVPASLVGKWYIRQYTLTASTSISAGSPYTFFRSDTATNVYYQFKSDGTGIEQTNFDFAFVIVPPVSFNYNVSGSNITFSNNSTILMAPTCSFEMPTSTTLVIRSTYSYTQGNYIVNNLQEVYLSR